MRNTNDFPNRDVFVPLNIIILERIGWVGILKFSASVLSPGMFLTGPETSVVERCCAGLFFVKRGGHMILAQTAVWKFLIWGLELMIDAVWFARFEGGI